MLLNVSIMFMTGTNWFRKTTIIVLTFVVYTILVLSSQRVCYAAENRDEYPVLQLVTTKDFFKFNYSCNSYDELYDVVKQIMFCFMNSVLTCYSGYFLERQKRLEFAKKWALVKNRIHSEIQLEAMEAALRAKALNSDQIQLVDMIMGSHQNTTTTTTTTTGPLVDALTALKIDSDEIKMLKMNIGRGASGDVHQAEWKTLPVAVKQLTQINTESMKNFRYEILLMNQLRHPNIVLLLGALWSKEVVGLVLEFAGGGSLADILRSSTIASEWTWGNKYMKVRRDPAASERRPNFQFMLTFACCFSNSLRSPRLAIQLATDIASGMTYLHTTSYWDENLNERQKCIIHRDLKPGNVLLDDTFATAKVSDFGSSIAYQGQAATMTMTGTPIYMVRENRKVK